MDSNDKRLARAKRMALFEFSVNATADDPRYASIIKNSKMKYGNDSAFSKLTRKAQYRAIEIATAFTVNGPDLFVDRYLRNFLKEYNNRLFEGHGSKQPQSFNIMREFVEPDEHALVLRLLEERYYSVGINYILESITNPSAGGIYTGLKEILEESIIYQLNIYGGYAELGVAGDNEIVLYGMACVRDQDELSIMAVLGKTGSEFKYEKLDYSNVWPGKEFLLKDSTEVDMGDIGIFDSDDIKPIVVMCRVTLSDHKVQARYVLEEKKDAFVILTDDPQALEDMRLMSPGEELISASLAGIVKYKYVIEIVEQLPTFFLSVEKLEDEITIERRPTKIRTEPNSKASKSARKNLSISDAPNYVQVSTIPDRTSAQEEFKISPSNLVIETSGYWKTLPMSKVGIDRSGQPIQGKTWVTQRQSWYEQTELDSKIGAPIEIKLNSTDQERAGCVYVMRSALHPPNIYKVGFTTKTASERAKQLGSTSGQPDMFHVVQEWNIEDPRAIEREIHRRLTAFRINLGREFFDIEYQKLRKCIDEVIELSSPRAGT